MVSLFQLLSKCSYAQEVSRIAEIDQSSSSDVDTLLIAPIFEEAMAVESKVSIYESLSGLLWCSNDSFRISRFISQPRYISYPGLGFLLHQPLYLSSSSKVARKPSFIFRYPLRVMSSMLSSTLILVPVFWVHHSRCPAKLTISAH